MIDEQCGDITTGTDVEVQCKYCHNNFHVTKEKFKYNKRQGRGYICPECKSNIAKNNSLKAKAKLESMNDDEKNKFYHKRAIGLKKSWSELTTKDRMTRIENAKNGCIAYWKNASSAERKKKAEQTRNTWNKLTVKEYQERCNHIKDYWNNMSNEELYDRMRVVWDGRKSWWVNLSPEEYQQWRYKTADGYNKYLSTIGLFPNGNELSIISVFNKYNIRYRYLWYNTTKHKDFDKMFPINPVTGSNLINPYHQWDFILHLKTTDILIDVDGSIHDTTKTDYIVTHETGKKIKLSELISFNDSQRPYQTDGIDAYVVQCYDDNIDDSTNVMNVVTGDNMSFKTFISLLLLMDMDSSEKKVIMDIL